MEITDFSKGQIWAILPTKFEALMGSMRTFNANKKDLETLRETRPSRELYYVENGTAVIEITGALTKTESIFSYLYGGTSYSFIQAAVKSAANDNSVEQIILNIDSPGGTVSGVEATAQVIREVRQKKPIIAFASGQMASAAYWIGSAANRIVAEATSEIGSIGVLMCHYDFSEWDKNEGLKRTFITAGKYKAIGNDSEPLTDEARDIFQDELDAIYKIFVDSVALNRGTDTKSILKVADGRVFIGAWAKDKGLVDEIGNFNSLITDGKGVENMPDKKIESIDQLTAEYPDLVKKIQENSVKSVDVETPKKDAVEQILGLVYVHFGQEQGEKFKTLIETGVTAEQLKAIKAIEPKQEQPVDKNELALEKLKKTGAENPGFADEITADDTPKDFMSAVEAVMVDKGISRAKAVRQVVNEQPELHEQYLNSLQ